MSISVLICDDDSLIRESLKIILSMDKDLNVVSICKNGIEATDYCLNNQVDVALLDIRMPKLNGVEATKKIFDNTSTKIIILTTFDEDEYISSALKNGAKGYLLKSNSPDTIINTIKVVHNGNGVIENKIIDRLVSTSSNLFSKTCRDIFSRRELEIIELIADGLSNREISEKLFITEGTVKNYITNILTKTNLKHRTQIAVYYLKGEL
ncbi:MAG: response regulator [Clostridium sp.]